MIATVVPIPRYMENRSDVRRLRARISGRVQGVGYRHFAVTRARGLDLSGWVRNEWDGTVSTVAEGPSNGLEAYLDYLRTGPATGRVSHVEVSWENARGEFSDFEVR